MLILLNLLQKNVHDICLLTFVYNLIPDEHTMFYFLWVKNGTFTLDEEVS